MKNLLIHIFNKLFATRIDLDNISRLNTFIDFDREQRGACQILKSQNTEEDINLYQNDLKSLFENVKVLMYYQTTPGDLQELLNFNNQYRNLPRSFTDRIDLTLFLSSLLKIAQTNLTVTDIVKLIDGQLIYYSQEGEDIILSRIFSGKAEGFYVDIGAHHPKRFSNTYYFYQLGWRGLNIEPNPEIKKLFDDMRPGDTSLDIAVANEEAESNFYVFDEAALNTFSKSLSEEYQGQGHNLLEVRKVKTRRLSGILEEYINGRAIDFMSVDVEDFELPVLESNNWDKFRPKILLVEILNFDVNQSYKFPVHKFLVEKGYEMWAKLYNTVLYKDKTG